MDEKFSSPTIGGNAEERPPRITSIDATYIDRTHIDARKTVDGIANNIQIKSTKEGGSYAYINLDNTRNHVSAYLPEAFYGYENNTRDRYERYISILKKVRRWQS